MSHQRRQFGQTGAFWLAFCAGALTLAAAEARAINWEGHDDPALKAIDIHEFTRGVPPPLPSAIPTCAVRAAQKKKNVYEQSPIPGKNCVAEE